MSNAEFFYVVGGVISVFVGIGAYVAADHALLAWFAPKVWLIKELASLLK